MGLLKKILKKISRLPPFRGLQAEANEKINNKLNTFIQPLNLAVADLGRECSELKNVLGWVSNTNREHLTDLTVQALDYQALYPDFCQALGHIVGRGYQPLLSRARLLFVDIIKNYREPGGMWRLAGEIAEFTQPPPGPASKGRPRSAAARLKILVVSGMFPSIAHGGGLRLFDLLTQLAEDHDLDLFAVFDPDLDQHSLDLLQGKLGQTKLVAHLDFTAANLLAWLGSLERGEGYYDVIQCEYPYSVSLVEVARPYGGKIGFTYMECVTMGALIKLQHSIAAKDYPDLGRLARTFWEIAVVEQTAARTTDFQIAVTPEDADFIERVSGVRPEIVPTCISPSEVIARIAACGQREPEGQTVVFLGYFDHFPNVDGVKWYLQEIHPEVKRAVPGYRFLVVGTGNTSSLRELAADDPTVEFTGRVDDIIPYILKGKVCILPLISGAGIRGKLNQYSIAGRPSVTTTIGNLGLNYRDGEEVLLADDAQGFAAAVVRLLTDEALHRKVAAQAKRYAEAHFTWAPHLARLEEIYRR